MEGPLLLCAFLTFVAVSAAAVCAVICACIVYSWQKQLQTMLENAPLKINSAIELAAQNYAIAEENLRRQMLYQQQQQHPQAAGPSRNEEEDSWAKMRGYQ